MTSKFMTSKTLSYSVAKQIYLEIYNHPKIINKYIELGLNMTDANKLASKISQDISNYTDAVETYKRDLYGGIVLTIIGMFFFLINYKFDESGYEKIKALKYTLFAGLGLLWSARNKKKSIKDYESK